MILVLNCGSQSIKWKVFSEKLKALKEGKREILNTADFEKDLEKEIEKIIVALRSKNLKISIIGHRVVHGKNIFREKTEIKEENLKELDALNYLSPLHNPFNVLGIKICQKILIGVPQFAVFDTEFFKDLPEVAYTYALPKKIIKEFGFRRYGFHGISYEYAARKAAEKIKKPFEKLKIITCHLCGGASITAIKNGKAIDTSMGYSPTEGVIMMTRSGDIDNEIILKMSEIYGVEKASDIINKESGLLAICGEKEMLAVLDKNKNGDKKSKLALEIFVYQIKKYIGAYYAILGGCDILVFTGAVGFGSVKIRNMICKDLNILKKTKVRAIETNEELAIAIKILNLK